MSAISAIEWTDRTWNPVRGCSVISPGCANCYAMKQAHRFSGPGQPYDGLTKASARSGPQWTGDVSTVESALLEPLSWRKPQRVFVNSMSDLFHEGVPDEFIDRVFAVMALAPRHTFQILTKRPERMRAYLSGWGKTDLAYRLMAAIGRAPGEGVPVDYIRVHVAKGRVNAGPLPNVWLGVSVEDQPRADERIPLLLQTPASVRFISAEPLLGPLDLEAVPLPTPGASVYGLKGVAQPLAEKDTEPDDWKYWTRRESRLDWVIVGGESGPGARRCSAQWVRSVVRQCRTAGVPVFVKQLGAYVIDRNDAGFDGCEPRSWPDAIQMRDGIEDHINGFREDYQGADVRVHLLDRKGGDPAEWPADLRVREFPQ